jgi:hypothetical protein
VLGDNRKLLVFKLDEVNEMTRGKGKRGGWRRRASRVGNSFGPAF